MNGLGDLLAVVLHQLGVTQKPDCGCARRQARLNAIVPFPGRDFSASVEDVQRVVRNAIAARQKPQGD